MLNLINFQYREWVRATLHNTIKDYIAASCEKLAQGFYTAATWLGIEPRICDTLVRRSTSKPPSHLMHEKCPEAEKILFRLWAPKFVGPCSAEKSEHY